MFVLLTVMSQLSTSSFRKRPSKKNYSFEDYFYSEYAEFDPETYGHNICTENGSRKSSAKRRRSRSLKHRITSSQNKNPSSEVSNKDFGTTHLKIIDPVDCPECFATIKITSLVKHIWDHFWNSLSSPSNDDPSFNLCNHCCRNFKSEEDLRFHFLGVCLSHF